MSKGGGGYTNYVQSNPRPSSPRSNLDSPPVLDDNLQSGGESHYNFPKKEVWENERTGSQGRRERKEWQESPARVERKPVVCYGCNEIGHIKPNCPNIVRRIREKGSKPGALVNGFLAGTAVSGLRVDTGSSRTLVMRQYVPKAAYTGRSVLLYGWCGGQPNRHELARIKVKVGPVEVLREVAVADTLDSPALLGMDLGRRFRSTALKILMSNLEETVVPVETVVEGQPARAAMNDGRVGSLSAYGCDKQASVIGKQAEEQAKDMAVAQPETSPMSMGEIFNFSDAYFEREVEENPVEECDTLPEVSGVEEPCLDGSVVMCRMEGKDEKGDDAEGEHGEVVCPETDRTKVTGQTAHSGNVRPVEQEGRAVRIFQPPHFVEQSALVEATKKPTPDRDVLLNLLLLIVFHLLLHIVLYFESVLCSLLFPSLPVPRDQSMQLCDAPDTGWEAVSRSPNWKKEPIPSWTPCQDYSKKKTLKANSISSHPALRTFQGGGRCHEFPTGRTS